MTKRLLMLLTFTPSIAFANAVWTQLGGMSTAEIPLIEADLNDFKEAQGEQRDDVSCDKQLDGGLEAPDEALTE